MDLYTITNIVMPSDDACEYSSLFVRTECNKLMFNTWMNMFAAKKYSQYCELGEIYLRLEAKGDYRLELVGSKRSEGEAAVDEVIFSAAMKDEACVHIPEACAYEGLYFTIIQNPAEPVTILSGAWCTDKSPQRQNKIAIISCTFKREEYITKNVGLFEQFIRDNPELKGRIKLYVVDNGKTLPMSIESENVKLYPNINAGGAGGFTRGLIEVCKQNEGYTRVLFMDDDVEVFPESFFRTLILADYLKEASKNAFINGAMLNLYDKNLFYENLAELHGAFVRPYHAPCELTYENILRVNNIPESVFHNTEVKVTSAWWYSCFPIGLVEEKGLPMPVFVRWDDLEWGWRNFGNTHISMNGICVWHAPFVFRVSKAIEYYYMRRNLFLVHSVHTPSFKTWWKDLFLADLKYLSNTYNYAALEMLSMALQDILRGAEAFREDPVAQLQRVNAPDKNVCRRECSDQQEMDAALSPHTYEISRVRKWLSKITGGGLYCPAILKKTERSVPDWFPSEQAFDMVKTVRVYNPLKQQYEVRKSDMVQRLYYKKQIISLLNQIEQRFDELQSIFKQAHAEFSTEEFWRNYLKLDS